LLVQVNGEDKELSEGTLLSELITQLDLPVQRVAVELNRAVVRRLEWATTELHPGDRIEIVHFVGGGAGFASSTD
jgi:thiamine biosynthesis protein ThiS